MGRRQRSSLREILEHAPYGSKQLLDALEVAMDAKDGLLRVWEERVRRDEKADEEFWPRDGWVWKYRRWEVEDDVRFKQRNLSHFHGPRVSGDFDDDTTQAED